MKYACIPLCLVTLSLACGNPETQIDTQIASPVTVEEVAVKLIEEYITVTGTISATHDAILKAETAGYYRLARNPETGTPFMFGDFVKKDQIIIYIDNPEQENNIRIDAQKLDLEISQSEHEKQKSLYEMGGVTLRELKNAEIAYINSKYSYDNAIIQLSKLKITAPFDGIIADLPYYTEGLRIDAGSEMVYIMNYEKLTMEVKLPGKLLGSITENQPVRVMNYTIPEKVLAGTITQVSPVLDPETRTFKATVEINNPDLVLRPGMFVKSEVIVASNDSTIVIPKNIILSRRNRKIVYVVDQGTAFERSITTGLENPDEVEVSEGLEVNERLVVEGFETLRNRSKVNIVR